MSEPADPPRLIDDPTAAPQVRAALEAGREDVATDEQVSALRAALTPMIWPAAGAGAAAAAGASAKAKLAAVIVVAATAGGGTWAAIEASNESPTPLPAPPTRTSQTPERTPERVGAADPSETTAPPAGPERAQAAVTAPASKRKEPAAKPPSEVQLLDAARAALGSNPKRALYLTREHARRFPKGMLAQEREVLAIEALDRLGRDSEAKSRADQFGRQHPGSAHRIKVEELRERE